MHSRVYAQPEPASRALAASRPAGKVSVRMPSTAHAARTGPVPPAASLAEILEYTRADRTHPQPNAAAASPKTSHAITPFQHILWRHRVEATTHTSVARSPELKARPAVTLSRSPLPAKSPNPPDKKTRVTDAAKAQTGVSVLRAQAAAIKGKLEAFGVEKLWRDEYHTSTESQFAQINKLFDEHAKLEKELRDILDEWYIFEHESTKTTIEKLNRVWNQIAQMYWDVRRAAETEAKYETKSTQAESLLWAQFAGLTVEIENADKPGKELSTSDFQSLRSRLDQLSAAVDKLRADETAARKQYTGSEDLGSHGP